MKKEKTKCDNCDKNAEYEYQVYSHQVLFDLEGNEINRFENGDPDETTFYCEKCAENEGII